MKTTSKLITLLMIITMTCSCGNPKKKAETITSGWPIVASPTLDMNALKKHQAQYPERWKATFEYLKSTELSKLTPGEYEIIGRDIYAIVSEYAPKEETECNFEVCEYDEKKDIVFFKPDAPAIYEVATPGFFYVFFPKDAHRPSIKEEDGMIVKKIVIKIKI